MTTCKHRSRVVPMESTEKNPQNAEDAEYIVVHSGDFTLDTIIAANATLEEAMSSWEDQ